MTLTPSNDRETIMSKGMNSKKQTKKEPQKSFKEKRAARKAKKGSRGGMTG